MIVSKYNRGMGGVDVIDKLLGAYRPVIRGKKWWYPLFTNALNISVVAAWRLYGYLHNQPGGAIVSQSSGFPTNHCFVFDEDGCTWKTSFSWLCRRTTCWYQIRWIRPWKLICNPREMHCLWHKYPKSVPKMWSSSALRERKKLLQIVPWQVAYIQAESDKNFCLFV